MNFKDNSNLGWKIKSGSKNTEDACGVINTYNLIKSTFFYLKISQAHMFCSKFSQVHMFFMKIELVPEPTHSGVS